VRPTEYPAAIAMPATSANRRNDSFRHLITAQQQMTDPMNPPQKTNPPRVKKSEMRWVMTMT
jgi:hypothetical protein